jgi:hypothetical protein
LASKEFPVSALNKSVILVLVLLLSGCYVRPIGVRYTVGVPVYPYSPYNGFYYNNSFRYRFGFPGFYSPYYRGFRIYPYNYHYPVDRFRPYYQGGGYYRGGYYRWH